MKDLRDYLASAGDKPDAGIVRALTGAIERSAAKAPEPGVDMSNTKPAAELNMTTKEFLDEQNKLEWARRNQHEVDAILANPKFDLEEWEATRLKAQGRALIGNPNGSTYINGEKP